MFIKIINILTQDDLSTIASIFILIIYIISPFNRSAQNLSEVMYPQLKLSD